MHEQETHLIEQPNRVSNNEPLQHAEHLGNAKGHGVFDGDITFEDDVPFDMSDEYDPELMDMFTAPTDFSDMKDGDMIAVLPEQLVDFPMGNARRKRNARIDGEILESMRKRWIIQPVVARPSADGLCLELLGGYGRRDKAKLINSEMTKEGDKKLVPVLVRVVNDAEAYAIHLAENTQRENLSLLEESLAAQLYVTNFAGDRKAAASELGWTLTKLNERLELCLCTEKVKDALELDRISGAHAILLAPFPDEVQDLQVENIINNNISVRRLREIVGKVQLPIEQAKFDTKECQTCPHNNISQLGLFGGTETNAKCAKATCYQDKTTQWLNNQREQAEARYGKVLFLSQTSKDGRNTISSSEVGQEQFSTGCATCESNVVVMNDSAGKEGLITESQCIDKPCFIRLSTAFKSPESLNSHSNTKSESPTLPSVGKEKGATKKPSAQKSIVSALPSTVTENHKRILRQASANHLLQNVSFQLAVNLASIIHTGNYSDDNFNASNSFEKNLCIAMKMDSQDIQKITLKAIEYLASSASSIAGTSSVENILLSAIKTDKASANKVATDAWVFSDKHLQGYTIRHLVSLAEQSGIDKEVENEKTGSWSKLKSGSKGDLLKRICATTSDHASFAPPEFLKHVK